MLVYKRVFCVFLQDVPSGIAGRTQKMGDDSFEIPIRHHDVRSNSDLQPSSSKQTNHAILFVVISSHMFMLSFSWSPWYSDLPIMPYISQLGLLFPMYRKIKVMFQTTNQIMWVDRFTPLFHIAFRPRPWIDRDSTMTSMTWPLKVLKPQEFSGDRWSEEQQKC